MPKLTGVAGFARAILMASAVAVHVTRAMHQRLTRR